MVNSSSSSECVADAAAAAVDNAAASLVDNLCFDLDDFFLDFLSPLKLSLPRPDIVLHCTVEDCGLCGLIKVQSIKSNDGIGGKS